MLTLICWMSFYWRLCWRGGVKLPPRCISASRLERNKILTATPMFSGSNFSMVLSATLPDETGSQKSKMAAEKTVISRISVYIHDGNEIPTAKSCFRTKATRGDKWKDCPTSGYVGNQRWPTFTGSRNEITLFQLPYMLATRYQALYPCFRGRATRRD